MSLAWATIVVVILLTPGAFFFAGLYAPQAITRETVAISPLGQLAGIVCISFFLHGLFYIVVNGLLVQLCPWMAPVDLSHFFPVLNIEHGSTGSARETSQEFVLHAYHILVYFALVDMAGLGIGWACGSAIERRWIFFSRFARHPWLYQIRGSFHETRTSEAAVIVSALSKVQENGQIIRYEGQLNSIYLKTDGSISYMTLTGAKSSIIAMPSRAPLNPATSAEKGTPFIPGTISRGDDWSLQQSANIHRSIYSTNSKSDMLFLSGAEIHNFYLERRTWTGAAQQEKTLEAGRRQLAAAGIDNDPPSRPAQPIRGS